MSIPFSFDDVTEMKRFFRANIEETLRVMFQRCPEVARLSPSTQREVAKVFAGFANDDEAFSQDGLFTSQMMSIVDVSEEDEKKYETHKLRLLFDFFVQRISINEQPTENSRKMVVSWITELIRLGLADAFLETSYRGGALSHKAGRQMRDMCREHNLERNRKLIQMQILCLGMEISYYDDEKDDAEEED